MVRPLKKEISSWNEKVARYRWEFLRLNDNYQKELKELLSQHKEKQNASLLNPKVYEEGYRSVRTAWENFGKRWELTVNGEYFPDPSKGFDELEPMQKAMIFPYATNPTWLKVYEYVNAIDASDKIRIITPDFPINDIKLLNSIKIEINLALPITKIKREIEYVVKMMLELRKQKGLKNIVKPPWKDYDRFLQVYKFKKLNKSYRTIFKIVYSDIIKDRIEEYEKRGENVLEKDMYTKDDRDMIYKAFKRAEDLIDFDYKTIG